MYISSCSLTGFKPFTTKVDFQFASRVTAVVGPNRSGKTSLLQALALLGFISKNDRHADTGIFIQGPSDGVFNAAMQIAGRLETIVSGQNDQSAKYFTLDIAFSDGSTVSTTVTLRDDTAQLASTCQADSHMLRVTYVPRDMEFPRTTDEKIRKSETLELAELTAIGHLTAHYAAGLKAVKKLTELSEMINKVFPGIGELDVSSTTKVHRLRFKRNDTMLPWWREGSGVCFVLTIFAAVLYDQATRFASATNVSAASPFQYHHLLLLDEPSAPLHSQIIPVFMDALISLDVQVILATHSVDFLLSSAALPEEDMQCLSLHDTVPTLHPQLTDSLLKGVGLSSAEIQEALPQHGRETAVLVSLSASKLILYVEGSSDIPALRAFMEIIDPIRAARFQSKVVVEWTSGRKKISEYAQSAGTLASFLESWRATSEDRLPSKALPKELQLRIAVLVDRDYRPEEVIQYEIDAFSAALQKKPLVASPPDSIYTTWGNAVEWENFCAKPDALQAVLREKGSGLLANFDTLWKSNISKGRSKFVKEFGTSVTAAESSPGAKSAFAGKDFGEIFDNMDKQFQSEPTRGMDAKGLLQDLKLADPVSIKLILQEIGKEGLSQDLVDSISGLFTWAGV
ncbi:hypothetical protein HDU87_001219 [Geranomyces variabilis]|uniref:Uncharacterized protein n=1 Tax=Geranomyces variabilis TaxID=109894 RepID=A0AAD5TBA7_9FUNG|nr:hypothetical protein HDU87_001219 [Geranomyces variabilis]